MIHLCGPDTGMNGWNFFDAQINGSSQLQPHVNLNFCSTTPTLSIGSTSSADDSTKLYRNDNCTYIDHRLKLYLTMNVFSNDEEEFSLILKVSDAICRLRCTQLKERS